MPDCDRVVVVTGAGGSGCGRAIAERFARDGAVVVSDLNADGGRETVRRIAMAGGRAAFFAADVRDEPAVVNLIGFAEHAFGRLAVMVNNASGPVGQAASLDDWTETLRTELFGALFGTFAAVEAMRRGGGGAIVNLGSISALWHGRLTPAVSPAYDVAKSAVLRRGRLAP